MNVSTLAHPACLYALLSGVVVALDTGFLSIDAGSGETTIRDPRVCLL